jgi:hypothetical protein
MIDNEHARIDILADGKQKLFAFDFVVWPSIDERQIKLFIKNEDSSVVEVPYSNISVSLSAKTVTYPISSAPPISAEKTVIIARYLPALQQVYDFNSGNIIDKKALELALDYEMMISQQIEDRVDRLLVGVDDLDTGAYEQIQEINRSLNGKIDKTAIKQAITTDVNDIPSCPAVSAALVGTSGGFFKPKCLVDNGGVWYIANYDPAAWLPNYILHFNDNLPTGDVADNALLLKEHSDPAADASNIVDLFIYNAASTAWIKNAEFEITDGDFFHQYDSDDTFYWIAAQWKVLTAAFDINDFYTKEQTDSLTPCVISAITVDYDESQITISVNKTPALKTVKTITGVELSGYWVNLTFTFDNPEDLTNNDWIIEVI